MKIGKRLRRLQALLCQVGLRLPDGHTVSIRIVHCLPEQVTPAACCPQRPHSKLLSKTVRPLRILSTTPNTVSNGKKGMHNKAFINRVTKAPNHTNATSKANKTRTYPEMRGPLSTRLSHNNGADEAEIAC